MKIKFWGVRGSVASPGHSTVKYGGNTSCIEVIEGDSQIIIDVGTGVRSLGDALSPTRKNIYFLVSHTHLDHICGLPFFKPLYQPDRVLHFYGPEGEKRPFSQIIRSLFIEDVFPVPFEKIPAKLHFHELQEKTFDIGPFEVTSFFINHPGRTLGYVIRVGKRRVAYLCDHEPLDVFSHLSGKLGREYSEKIIEKLAGVNLLIHDAYFRDKDYAKFKGWGHSPWSYPVKLAVESGIEKVAFFHYAPWDTDAILTQQLKHFKKSKVPVFLAREGSTIAV